MTREEAIERLKQNKAAAEFYAQLVGNSKSADNELKDIEAFNMAIEALPEPSGDLISRADAIDTICIEWCLETFDNCPHADDGFRCVGCDDVEALMALPSAEAVHKPDYSYEADMVRRLKESLSAEAVPQSDQYKKGFEDAKREFLVEYARESKNMRKRNAQLEVMLNAQKAISAEAVQVVRCKDCRWYRDTFFHSKVNPYCVKEFDEEFGALRSGITEDSFCSWGERKGGEDE